MIAFLNAETGLVEYVRADSIIHIENIWEMHDGEHVAMGIARVTLSGGVSLEVDATPAEVVVLVLQARRAELLRHPATVGPA